MESYITEIDTKGHGMHSPPIHDQQFHTFNVVLPYIMWWRGDSGAQPTTQSAQPFINEHSTHQSWATVGNTFKYKYGN
jgi:hypothetical protein